MFSVIMISKFKSFFSGNNDHEAQEFQGNLLNKCVQSEYFCAKDKGFFGNFIQDRYVRNYKSVFYVSKLQCMLT